MSRSPIGRRLGWDVSCLLLIALIAPVARSDEVDYAPAIERLREIVDDELDRGILTGVSIALVDDQQTVFADGFGLSDMAKQIPATRETVYRAGSISKLFTAMSVMQLVEQGKLDLDAPITTYLPDFRVVCPFADAEPITLRQLMCHRSGLIREAPVGGYLDDTEPTIQETIDSIAPCVTPNRPNTVTRYSNLGVTVVGQAMARVAGTPFVQYQRERLLGPMGMNSSDFLLNDSISKRFSTSYMRVADGQGGFFTIESPKFELGTLPAGNLYTTADDLAGFLACLFAGGTIDGNQVITPESLAKMHTPQLTEEDEGFGMGFYVGHFREHRTFSHMGAVYGFTSSVVGLPEHKLGVVVLANEDISTGPVRKLSNAVLSLLLEAKLGEKPPAEPDPVKLDAEQLVQYAGAWESESYWARLGVVKGRLKANVSGQPLDFTATGEDTFRADGRWAHDSEVTFSRDDAGKVIGFTFSEQDFHLADPSAWATKESVPQEWKDLCGSYGPVFIPLVISIRHGHLYAMTENMADYRLTPVCRDVFAMPPGLYAEEQLVVQRDAEDRIHAVVLANMRLPRFER